MRMTHLAWSTVFVFVSIAAAAPPPKTFCNPLNLDYGLISMRGEAIHRHGADPCVVLFKDKYWLFSTWDRPGYRVSDDLVNWTYIAFPATVELPTRGLYTAAAASVIGEYLYFTEFGKDKARVALYRTRDPEKAEAWEKVTGELPPYADPCLFVDPPTGDVFMYSGLDKPIFGVQLDPKKNFAEVATTKKQLMDELNPKEKIRD